MSNVNELLSIRRAEDSSRIGIELPGDDNLGDNRNYVSDLGGETNSETQEGKQRNMAPTHGMDSGTVAEQVQVHRERIKTEGKDDRERDGILQKEQQTDNQGYRDGDRSGNEGSSTPNSVGDLSDLLNQQVAKSDELASNLRTLCVEVERNRFSAQAREEEWATEREETRRSEMRNRAHRENKDEALERNVKALMDLVGSLVTKKEKPIHQEDNSLTGVSRFADEGPRAGTDLTRDVKPKNRKSEEERHTESWLPSHLKKIT